MRQQPTMPGQNGGGIQNQGGGQGGSGLGNIFGQLFGNYMGQGKNPYDAAMQQYGQAPQQFQNIYGPYMQQGLGADRQAMGQYGQLINDPGRRMNEIGKGYQASPGYEWQKGQMTNAVNNMGAAGGMAGSPQNQQQMAETIGGLANQDYNRYLQNAMGMYGMGLNGMNQIGGRGMEAGMNYGNQMGNYYGNMAQLAGGGQQYQNQQNQNMWGGIGSALGSIFSGPIGGAVGDAAGWGLGSLFGNGFSGMSF